MVWPWDQIFTDTQIRTNFLTTVSTCKEDNSPLTKILLFNATLNIFYPYNIKVIEEQQTDRSKRRGRPPVWRKVQVERTNIRGVQSQMSGRYQ